MQPPPPLDNIVIPRSPSDNIVIPPSSSDGWYMMLAMDFAVQEINAHPEYDFQLESIKLDTCGTYESDFWLKDYTSVSDEMFK